MKAVGRVSAGIVQRTRWRLSLAAILAIGTSILVLSSPLTAAVAPAGLGLSGATKLTDYSSQAQGCAHAILSKPSVSLRTGDGKAFAQSSSKSCANSKGGVSTVSEGDSVGTVGIIAPIKLHAAASTVMVNFDLVAAARTSAVVGSFTCPVTTTGGSYPVTNGTEFYNVTSGDCQAEAEYAIQTTVIVSQAKGGGFAASYLYDSNESGVLDNIYVEQINFSSPSAGINATYNYSTVQYYGASNSTTFNSAYSLSASGSWNAGTTIIVQAYAFIVAECVVQGIPHATTSAVFNAGGGSNHLDITGIVVS
jgi:hypothetical protein